MIYMFVRGGSRIFLWGGSIPPSLPSPPFPSPPTHLPSPPFPFLSLSPPFLSLPPPLPFPPPPLPFKWGSGGLPPENF